MRNDMSMERRFLITRTDDAGASRRVNAAIRTALEGGLVRNVSVLACGPAVEELAEWLPLAGVAIGLHVALSSEWPGWRWGPVAGRATVPGLVEDDGGFTAAPAVLHARGVAVAEMMIEARAQLARLRRLGIEPDYLDEHMGVGWLPGLADALAELGRAEGLVIARPWNSLELPRRKDETDTDVVGRWTAGLHALGEGAAEARVLITHPGGEEHMPAAEAAWREGETLAWRDARWEDALRRAGVRPVSYPELARMR
jgi:predicted glycoside hydrolase/deacetylase ChbG (UPF0249 family)